MTELTTAAPDVNEIYQKTIRPLPAGDRLRLATIILNDIPPQSVVDYSDEWSEEDYRDFSKASWEHINQALAEAEDA
jgi:hypothetical protein